MDSKMCGVLVFFAALAIWAGVAFAIWSDK
jgi:hypothetical protein